MTAAAETLRTNRPALVTADSLVVDYAHLAKSIDTFAERAADDVPPVVEDDEDLAAITSYVKDIRAERKRIADIGDTEKRPYLDAHKTLHAWFNALCQLLSEMQDAVEARGNIYLQRKAEVERKRRIEIERKALEESDKARHEALMAAQKAKETMERVDNMHGNVTAMPLAQQAKTTAETALNAFAEANARADEASRDAAAKPADMARTRTTAGTASLRTNIEFTYDREKLDLEALRPFIREDELRLCINSIATKNKTAIMDGTFKLSGVTFTVGRKASFR